MGVIPIAQPGKKKCFAKCRTFSTHTHAGRQAFTYHITDMLKITHMHIRAY